MAITVTRTENVITVDSTTQAITVTPTEQTITVSDGTGVFTASSLGLGNVDNTSDLNKPISTATQAALDLKADAVSTTFAGLDDVTFTALADGNLAQYNSISGEWENVAASTVGVTDHTALSNIGTNTHAQIDTHIADATKHFLQSEISITESQISDLGAYLTDITGETIGELGDVVLTTPADTDVLQFNGITWVNVDVSTVGVTDHTGLSNIGTNTHAQIDTHIADDTKHRIINDAGTLTTELFSASKIISDLSGKSDTGHTHTKSEITDFTEGDYVHTTGVESIGGDKTFSDNVVVTGDLTVNGTTMTINTTELTVSDNIITLNNDEAGTPTQNAGIEVERGTSTNASLIWDETADVWKAGLAASETEISLSTHNHSGVYEPADATILKDSDIDVTVQSYDATNALTSDITYETLNTNGDVGTTAGTLAIGNHDHSGVYEPADATILKDADIGVTVEAYNANIQGHIGTTTGNPHGVTKDDVGLSNLSNILNKYDATTAPITTDDSNAGYAVGSHWFDVTNDDGYVCVDASAGSAVWVDIGLDTTDHTLLSNIGTNSHGQIDTHIADSTVHFTQAAISITESQISDLQSYSLDTHTHTAGDSSINVIGTPSGDSLQDFVDAIGGTGIVGGSAAITDNGDGTVAVASCQVHIRTTNSESTPIYLADVAANASLTLTTDALNYIYVDYNAGSPQYIASTTEHHATDHHTYLLVGTAHRDGTTVHINNERKLRVSNPYHVVHRLLEVHPFEREYGALIGETGTRNLSVSAGKFWEALNYFNTAAFDSSGTDTFSYYYRDGAGGWTEQTAQTQITNASYDDGDGTLGALTNNKYGVSWVYMDIDGDINVLYGWDDYTLADAQTVQPPSSVPGFFEDHAQLLGKIIVEEGTATFQGAYSAFDITFTNAGVTDHADLTNIGTNTHAEIDTHIADLTNPHSVTKTQVGLSDVENILDKNDATLAPGVNDDNTAGYSIGSHWVDTTNDKVYVATDVTTGAAVWVDVSQSAGTGEANTASNIGTAGVGVYDSKSGVDLRFKKLNVGSNKISITDDVANDEIDFDVNEANLTITESQISDLGTYLTDITGESINSLSNVYTPMSPTDGQVLTFDTTNGWQAESPTAGDLDDLTNVTITANSAGEILKWNGAAWVNNTLTEAGIAAETHTHATSDITSGTFADARIAATNVTQHQAALSITESQISDFGSYSLSTHNHSGVYEPADATILKDADISSTVQSYDANTRTLKDNLSALVMPGISDDNTAGYAIGSMWVNTDANDVRICTDATTGAGVWVSASSAFSDLVDDTSPQLGGDLDLNGKDFRDTNGNLMTTFSAIAAADSYLQQKNGTDSSGAADIYDAPGFISTGVSGDIYFGLGSLTNTCYVNGNIGIHDGGYIVNSSRANLIKLGSVGSSTVNHFELQASNSTVPIKLSAAGTDTNIDFDLEAKGTGTVHSLSDLRVSNIVETGATDINITPDTGAVVIDGLAWPTADGTADYYLKTNGAGQLSWAAGAAGLAAIVEDTTPQLGGDLDVNGSDIVSASAGDIAITPDTTGSIVLDGLNWPQADGTTGQVLQTNGTGQLSWASATSGSLSVLSDTTITGAAKGDLLVHNGTAWIDVSVGTNNHVLTADSTEASGVKWAAAGGALANVVEDTTPQLGGDLDRNDKQILTDLNNQTGTAYTCVLADADKTITATNAAANTITIPANASVAYPIGTVLTFHQLGTGATTIAITTDTLNYPSTATAVMNGQYSWAFAQKMTSTTWSLFGSLVAA